MKNLTTKCMIAVAALAAAAGSASAQVLKAEIPFTFRAGKTLMAPGTYEVNLGASNTGTYFRLRNADSRASVLLANFIQGDVSRTTKAKGVPTIAFECADARCVLREVWTAGDSTSYHFQGPSLGRDADTRMAAITMTRAKAD